MKASFRFGAYSIIMAMVLFLFVLGCGAAPAGPTGEDATALGSITGNVSWLTQQDQNKDVVGITVRVWKPGGTEQVAIGITDSAGHYVIPSLNPATYVVSAYQAASTSGTQKVEKCWVSENINVQLGMATHVNFSFGNDVVPADHPQCKA